MKNFVFTLLAIIIVSVGFTSCTEAEASKNPEKTVSQTPINATDYITTLREAGFENLPVLITRENEQKRQEYKNKYGLNFISTSEMITLLDKNDVTIAESKFYIGEIPESALAEFEKNYNKLKEKGNVPGYMFEGKFYSDEWLKGEGSKFVLSRMVVQDGTRTGAISVVGPSKYFDQKAIEKFHEGADPIIVAAVPDGYLELARW